MLEGLDKKAAVKIGDGSKEVIEFSDVDCPFCKRAEKFFEGADVTRYIFLFPLDAVHPRSADKSIRILCSEDPGKAYEKVMKGEDIDVPKCEKGEEKLSFHRAMGNKMGVESVPSFWIDGIVVNGADPKIVEMLKAKEND